VWVLLFNFIPINLPSQLHDRNADLERKLSESLLDLEDRTQDLETARKRSNRDVPLGVQDVHKAITPKYDASTLRDEVAGLKYVCWLESVHLWPANQTYRSGLTKRKPCCHTTDQVFGVREPTLVFWGRATSSSEPDSFDLRFSSARFNFRRLAF
jgi:hypothetical protein